LNDIERVTEGAHILQKNILFADDLFLPSNEHADLQTMLNKLRVYADRESITVNTQKLMVMCFNSTYVNLPPVYFDGVLLPYTDSFKYLGMVCNKQINLNTAADATFRPFTAGTFKVKRVCSET
jgi:hypothetical protein